MGSILLAAEGRGKAPLDPFADDQKPINRSVDCCRMPRGRQLRN
ncbi:hypothetical protein [Rhodopirellula bahusiensis]